MALGNWGIVNPFGIQKDTDGIVWHAGHVNDVLPLEGGRILAGSDTGGVWLIDIQSDRATPLSNDWLTPDIHCLARGPDGPHHIYAGASGGLWVTDVRASEPLAAPWILIPFAESSPPFLPSRSINRIVVTEDRRLVIASSGGGFASGLYWATIPKPGSNQRYVFRGAVGLPRGDCYGLAEGPNRSVVVTMPGQGFFHGGWANSGDLVMQKPSQWPADVDVTIMGNASVTSYPGDRNTMYAVGNDPRPHDIPICKPCQPPPTQKGVTDLIYALLHSSDGGQTWNEVTKPVVINRLDSLLELRFAGGNQGNYNQGTEVSPVDPSTVALCWRGGPFLSNDAGQTWRQYGDEGLKCCLADKSYAVLTLHGDEHAVRFSGDGTQLYVASDGGVTSAAVVNTDRTQPPFLQNFIGTYNKNLANLQFEAGGREFYGTFSHWGLLVAGGLQDNGNVYCRLGTPGWRQAADSDGNMTLVLPNDILIFCNNSDTTSVARAAFNGDEIAATSIIPTKGPTSASIMQPVADPVPAGALASALDASQFIIAIAGLGSNLWGLFPDSDPSNAAGVYWLPLGTLTLDAGDFITAVGSYDGLLIFAGTKKGRMFQLNLPTPSYQQGVFGPPAGLDVSQVVTGWINQIVVNTSGDPPGFACLNDANGVGTILQLAQGNWNALFPSQPATGEYFYSLAVNWNVNPPQLFVATDSKVYASFNGGTDWEDFSQGLPANPHRSALRSDETALYLSTFGRSLWATEFPVPVLGTGGEGGGGAGGGGFVPPGHPPIVPE